MEKNTTVTLDEQITKANEKLAEIRSAKKEFEQERALMDAPMNKENRNAEKAKVYEQIQNGLKENRSVTVGNTGTVNVARELIYSLTDKDDVLNRFSLHAGASASNVIPVWNSANTGTFASVAEDGTFTSEGSALAAITVEPKAMAKSLRVSAETLKLSAVEFESEITKILTKATRNTILKGIFEGIEGRFVAVDDNATEVEVSALNPSALQKLALTIASKTDNGAIYINPLTYASIVDSNSKKDEILLKQIIESKKVEGVDLILSAFVPAGKVLAFEAGNYGIGIADELEITPKNQPNTLSKIFDASIFVAGKPIVEGDVYTLKVTA